MNKQTEGRFEKSRKKICGNCKYIQRPFNDKPMQADLNQPAHCCKVGKFMKTDTEACALFVLWSGTVMADEL